jgi:hypothetical protein
MAQAQTPAAVCTLPADPGAIPAAIDAAITGPADQDRACTKVLFRCQKNICPESMATCGAAGRLFAGRRA